MPGQKKAVWLLFCFLRQTVCHNLIKSGASIALVMMCRPLSCHWTAWNGNARLNIDWKTSLGCPFVVYAICSEPTTAILNKNIISHPAQLILWTQLEWWIKLSRYGQVITHLNIQRNKKEIEAWFEEHCDTIVMIIRQCKTKLGVSPTKDFHSLIGIFECSDTRLIVESYVSQDGQIHYQESSQTFDRDNVLGMPRRYKN